jgi:hypothetical protein
MDWPPIKRTFQDTFKSAIEAEFTKVADDRSRIQYQRHGKAPSYRELERPSNYTSHFLDQNNFSIIISSTMPAFVAK